MRSSPTIGSDAESSGKRILGLVSGALLAITSAAHAQLQTTTYTYDALGRLKTVAAQSGDTVTYVYDAAGNRIQVTQAGPPPPPPPPPPPAPGDPSGLIGWLQLLMF